MSLTQAVTWIPVEERLPNYQQKVVVACNDPYGNTLDAYRLVGAGFHHWTTGKNILNVTHWALPLTHPAQLQAEGEK